MDARGQLRSRAPRLYTALLHSSQNLRVVREAPARRRALRLMQQSDALTVDVSRRAGIGGLLWHAVWALELGRQYGTDVALRFVSPTYMPSPPVVDWLDAYFTRTGTMPRAGIPVVDSAHLPSPQMRISEAGALLWSYMMIRPEVRAPVERHLHGRYVAVHYRGSDKVLERKPADPEWLLDQVSGQAAELGVERIFIASDEGAFFDRAAARFGDRAFWLPQEAKATGVRPAHFSAVSGQVKAAEALQTMVALGGAEAIVRSDSYLSQWAESLARPGTRFVVAVQEPA